MLITRLELENFKSYASACIAFTPGTNAIIGANGAGKSSLLEAIGFALFDYRPEGLKTENLLREGATAGRVVVGLVSSRDERAYDVERAFGATATTRYRVYDAEIGAYVAQGAEEVAHWLRDHLSSGSDIRLRDLFVNTVGVPQGTITAPFLQAPSARKAIFDPLLQAADWAKASDALLPTQRSLEGQAAQLREAIARLEGELTRLEPLLAERAALEEASAQMAARLADLERDLTGATAALQRLDAAERALRESQERLNSARVEARSLEARLSDARQALAEAVEARQRVAGSRPGYEAYLEAEGRLRELDRQRARRDKLVARQSALQRDEAAQVARIEQLDRDLMQAAQAAQRMAELAPAVEKQRALEALLDEARQAQSALVEAQRRAREIEAQAQRDRLECQRIEAEGARARAYEADLAERQESVEELASRIARAREEVAASRAERERLARQSETLAQSEAARCPTCEAELTPEHRRELLARNAGQMAALDQRVAQLAASAEAGERDRKRLQAEVTRLQRELRALATEADRERAEAALAERLAALAEAGERVAQLEGAAGTATDLAAELAALGDPRREYQRAEDIARTREEKERQRASSASQREALAAQLDQVQAELSAFAGLDLAIQEAQGRRDRYQEAYALYMGNIGTAEQLGAREGRVEQLEDELAALKLSLAELAQAHEAAQAAYDPALHAEARERTQTIRDDLAAHRARLEQNAVRLQAVTADIAGLHAAQGALVVQQTSLQETEELLHTLGVVRARLREAGPHVTQQYVQRISREASGIFADIMGDRTGRLTWSENYELALEVRGHRRSFPQFSGGEQMCAALALRLALLREMSAIDVAFFDEPTAHLDPERRDGLAERIMQVKGFSQVFVISHDDTFERAAQNHLRIVKDASGSRLGEA